MELGAAAQGAGILDEARRAIKSGRLDGDKVIVVAQKGWPIGIIGIVASRIADEFHRPCIVISVQGPERALPSGALVGRGSARARGSGPAFPWHEVLAEASICSSRSAGTATPPA